MTVLWLQDAVASGVALLAVVMLVRRVTGFFTPAAGSACSSCASRRPCASTSSPAGATPIPVEMLRAPRHS
jgi:hypothetical protein